MKTIITALAIASIASTACAEDVFDGPFVGAFGGYGAAALSGETEEVEMLAPEGWILGVAAGANFTIDAGLVVGVIGDVSFSNMTDAIEFSPSLDGRSTIDMQGSVRGRTGYAIGGLLPYLTAGAAFAHHTIEQISSTPDMSLAADAMHLGWTTGIGLEVAASDQMAVDLLYRYSDYGSANYDIGGDEADIALTAHQLTIGLNVGF